MRRLRLALCLGAGLGALALAPAGALAAPAWEVKSTHGPQHFEPGGVGQYVIETYNVGDAASSGTLVVTDTLPAGVTVTAVGGPGWFCSGVGTGIVTCQRGDSIPAGSEPEPSYQRGAVPVIRITVAVDRGPGTADNVAKASGGGAAAAASDRDPTVFSATPAGFGIVPGSFAADAFAGSQRAAAAERQAGSHPFELRVGFDLNLKLTSDELGTYTEPDENMRTNVTRLPRGFVGNPEATPRCSAAQLESEACPIASQVGAIDLLLQSAEEILSMETPSWHDVPVYNMVPPGDAVAAFAFVVLQKPVWIEAGLDPADGYAVVTRIEHTNSSFFLRAAELTVWGVPGDPAHDWMRFDRNADRYGASLDPSVPRRPFLTLPTGCEAAGGFEIEVDSWQRPGAFVSAATPLLQATGCGDPGFSFEPTIEIEPTSHEAAAPTGLDVELTVPQNEDPDGLATPNLRDAVTRLPEGMAINPSAADGLIGCSQADVGLEDNEAPRCPDASKIGTVEIVSPLVPDTLKGFIYQAKQHDNPHGSLLGFYTVARGNGLTIKLAARVDADPETGRLTTTFLDNPQLAFEHYRLHFWGGERAPLVNPPTCGSFRGSGTFTSWNSEMPTVTDTDTAQITSGPNGSPCPRGLGGRPFAPGFAAGSTTPLAGAFSGFGLEVSREDGHQELRGLETTLPPGMLARLAGVPYCPEASLASISAAAGTGAGERRSPSCPAASLVGRSDAAAGAGSLPFHNPGNVYLTGPHRGAPLGLVVVTPIVAGPLDLGTVVVRAALHVDPVTAQARVVSDPIPDKLVVAGNGFPLNLRLVRVTMDRPGFTLNPTSCAEMAVGGAITSLQGARAEVANRFQVGGCAALGFKPRLHTRLVGGTGRGAHPKLRAVLKMPAGANIRRAAVSLPGSVILDQSNIRTVCTRVQFAADACPKGSIYGRAAAKSPLLDYVLRGPVYLRSSDDKLPNLVAVLRGPPHQPLEIELAGRIDSVRGGIRTVFATVPDAAVSKFALTMKGGKRQGLLQSTRNLCRGAGRALARFAAHNGRRAGLRPKLNNSCGKGKRKAQKRGAPPPPPPPPP
ncbi:MAG: hypothetical protein WDZ46_06810, partial [Solirubrobacterales bacterium]